MSSNQKANRKDFSLGQYYSQLEKYQSGINNSKSRLRKDNSISSFSKQATYKETPFKEAASYIKDTPTPTYKEPNRTTNSSTLYKAAFLPDRQKIIISEKSSSKPTLEKFDSGTIENVKKGRANEQRKFNSYLVDSLANSAISKKWPTENAQQKENVSFTTKEEKAFTDHCSQIYRLRPSPSLVEDISREINKRDEVYQLVAAQFPQCPQEKYGEALQGYFQEHQLMQRIIKEFKAVSKLDMEDLNELYYFLKTDR